MGWLAPAAPMAAAMLLGLQATQAAGRGTLAVQPAASYSSI